MSQGMDAGCGQQPEEETPRGGEAQARVKTVETGNPLHRMADREMGLLVAAGSAMAAGCEPCLDQLIPSLIEAGVSERDIRTAVEIGHRVKEAAGDYMKEVADVLAGTRLAGNAGPSAAPDKAGGGNGGCCG